MTMRWLALSWIGMAVMAPCSVAQPADTTITDVELLAAFSEARRLALDPQGHIYVVDAGRDVIVRLRPGEPAAILGGPGSGEGEFDDPADIDPTNGLVLIVADAGNNRIQRFSRAFSFLEALPVPALDRLSAQEDGRPSYQPRDAGAVRGDGRPVAVASTSTSGLYAIDEVQAQVVEWDAARRVVSLIGGFGSGEGALIQPVDLAADSETLYVADQGHGGVLVYDPHGTYLHQMGSGQAETIQAVTRTPEAVWLVLPDRILVYTPRGRFVRTILFELTASLVDAAWAGDYGYWLTEKGLYRSPLPRR